MKRNTIIDRLRTVFAYNNYVYSQKDIPVFIQYVGDDYYTREDNIFNGLIINLKKEGKKMDARFLVKEQLDILSQEKEKLVAEIRESDKEVIEQLRLEAADQAEELYLAEAAKKVDEKFKLAEDHLKALLENLPEEVAPVTEEVPVADNTEENPLI